MNNDKNILENAVVDCAVCLQKCNHPTKLPCGHIFCFLCVKGITFQSKKCAMCRAEIPPNYLDNPILLEPQSNDEIDTTEVQENTFQWFYEGRNGWWQYDERSNTELETAFNAGDSVCTLLLAGTLYNIDFESMTQVRRSDQTRRRYVRRESPMFPSKGIAGIKTDNTRRTNSDNESDDVVIIEPVTEIIEINDSEDVIEPVQDDDVSLISDRISAINFDEENNSQDHEDT